MASPELLRFPLGPFQANAYVLVGPSGSRAVLIDPGLDVDVVLEAVRARNLSVDWILNTHGHLDHTSGNAAAKRATGAPIAIHGEDVVWLARLQAQGVAFGVQVEDSPAPDVVLTDGQTLSFDGLTIEVLHTPGHSPGSVCFRRGRSPPRRRHAVPWLGGAHRSSRRLVGGAADLHPAPALRASRRPPVLARSRAGDDPGAGAPREPLRGGGLVTWLLLLGAAAVAGALGWWANNRLGRGSLEAARKRAAEVVAAAQREGEKSKRAADPRGAGRDLPGAEQGRARPQVPEGPAPQEGEGPPPAPPGPAGRRGRAGAPARRPQGHGDAAGRA